MSRLLIFGIVVVILGTIADWYTTKEFRRIGLREANPIARWIMEQVQRRGGGMRAQVFAATLVFDGLVIWGMVAGLAWWSGTQAAALWLIAAGVAQLVVAYRNRSAIERETERRRARTRGTL